MHRTLGHALGQLGQRVADVYLAVDDVVRTAIQRLGQAQDRMLSKAADPDTPQVAMR